jgi:hypothetical protein
VVLGKATATLDCSALDALAYRFAVCGREKMRISRENKAGARLIMKEHTKHDFEWAYVNNLPFPLTNREFLTRFLCFKAKTTSDLVIIFAPLPQSTRVDYGANLKVVRGETTGVFRVKPINDNTQCQVTLLQHAHFGGIVPMRVLVAKVPQAMSGVGEMRELFQRDDAIDKVERDEFAGVIERGQRQAVKDEGDAIIERTREKLVWPDGLKELVSPDKLVKMHKTKGSRIVTGRASTVSASATSFLAKGERKRLSHTRRRSKSPLSCSR